MESITDMQANELDTLCEVIHENNVEAGWWEDLHKVQDALRLGKDPLENDKLIRIVELWFRATKIALIHSEVSEMLEALRKNLQDDKLPHRHGVEVEGGDVFIRLADLLGQLRMQLGSAVLEKSEFNIHRPDHKREAREGKGGKAV